MRPRRRLFSRIYDIGIAHRHHRRSYRLRRKEADQENILDLARQGAALAEKARHRKVDLPELRGRTHTITNYGVVGASYGTPIVDCPEVAIFGFGKIEDGPVDRRANHDPEVMPLSRFRSSGDRRCRSGPFSRRHDPAVPRPRSHVDRRKIAFFRAAQRRSATLSIGEPRYLVDEESSEIAFYNRCGHAQRESASDLRFQREKPFVLSFRLADDGNSAVSVVAVPTNTNQRS